MGRRKGEMTPAQIDRHWRHQVALPAEKVKGNGFLETHAFCQDLSVCPRGHFFWRDDVGYVVFCFAERAHAEAFQARFGGEFIDPSERPRWPRSRRR